MKPHPHEDHITRTGSTYHYHSCPNCGGDLLGDGYTKVIHCENAHGDALLVAPDSNIVFCNHQDEDYDQWETTQ